MFIIIWEGFGFVVPLLLLMIPAILGGLVGAFVHNGHYADAHKWIYGIGCFLGAASCWYVGKYLNQKPGRILLDEKTGQRVELKKTHSCFFIPVEYWSIIGFFLGIVMLFAK